MGQQKETLLMTYKAVGRSIADYAAPVWSTNARCMPQHHYTGPTSTYDEAHPLLQASHHHRTIAGRHYQRVVQGSPQPGACPGAWAPLIEKQKKKKSMSHS